MKNELSSKTERRRDTIIGDLHTKSLKIQGDKKAKECNFTFNIVHNILNMYPSTKLTPAKKDKNLFNTNTNFKNHSSINIII